MREYQKEYLGLLSDIAEDTVPTDVGAREFMEHAIRTRDRRHRASVRGTELLRDDLFPVLDNILSASPEEIGELEEFAGELMRGTAQRDLGLHYRIHLALMDYARHKGLRDMLIRELYHVGMSLYNFETMLSPAKIRLYKVRMRMCFMEAASYYETEYDDIKDPETRGYIHRAMGNIALGYDEFTKESAIAKLKAVSRSISILSDPDVRAKTPELPWDLYLFKSHQERTSLLSFLRSGSAGPDVFAKVMDSAQVVQSRQLKAARERGQPLQPRWQYAYMAARYHCGAMLLEELLDGLYALSLSTAGDDYTPQGMFAHLSAPAFYMEYLKQSKSGPGGEHAVRIRRMTDRMLAWLSKAPYGTEDEQMMFYLRQFLYAYREVSGGVPFYELLQDVFAMRYQTGFIRMYITGQIAGILAGWTIDDCPEKLVGLPGVERAEDAIWQRAEITDFAVRAGRLYDVGMVHFFRFESAVPRGLFEEEETILRLHAHCGSVLLSEQPSTAIYADIAKGHHVNFDEKGGFPLDFSPRESEVRPIIYIVAAADALASACGETASRYRPAAGLDDVFVRLERKSGMRYAPFVVQLLQSEDRRGKLRGELDRIKQDAFLDMYRRRGGKNRA